MLLRIAQTTLLIDDFMADQELFSNGLAVNVQYEVSDIELVHLHCAISSQISLCKMKDFEQNQFESLQN